MRGGVAASALQILKKSFQDPHKDGSSVVSISLVVFLLCNLITALAKLLRPQTTPDAADHCLPTVFDPVRLVASRALTAVMVYVATATYVGRQTDSWEIEDLPLRIANTWKRPAATLFFIELLTAASTSLLSMLRSLVQIMASSAAMDALLISASMVVLVCVGPILYAYSDIACKLSLVVSVLEDRRGAGALRRAGELVKGKAAEGFVLAAVMTCLEQLPFMLFGSEREAAGRVVMEWFLPVSIHLCLKFFGCVAYTVFYCQCRKNHEKA